MTFAQIVDVFVLWEDLFCSNPVVQCHLAPPTGYRAGQYGWPVRSHSLRSGQLKSTPDCALLNMPQTRLIIKGRGDGVMCYRSKVVLSALSQVIVFVIHGKNVFLLCCFNWMIVETYMGWNRSPGPGPAIKLRGDTERGRSSGGGRSLILCLEDANIITPVYVTPGLDFCNSSDSNREERDGRSPVSVSLQFLTILID